MLGPLETAFLAEIGRLEAAQARRQQLEAALDELQRRIANAQ